MEKELSYLSPEGVTVFTSQFLKNRGTCCRSACLHCPYGYTLKKLGLQFQEATQEDANRIQPLLEQMGEGEFGWQTFFPENVRWVLLKEQVVGLIFKNHIIVKKLALLPHFQNQGLSKELVESYFFY